MSRNWLIQDLITHNNEKYWNQFTQEWTLATEATLFESEHLAKLAIPEFSFCTIIPVFNG